MKTTLYPTTALLAFGLLGLVCACGEVVSGVDDYQGSVTQVELSWGTSAGVTLWTVLVVDDAPTEEARSLRALLVEDLHGFFDQGEGDCVRSVDPAAYRPIDQRLIVIGGSGTLEPHFRDGEGLHALGVDATPEVLAAYEEAGAQAILAMETSTILPFVGVSELAHYVNLLEGRATPRSSAEQELVGVGSDEVFWYSAALAYTRPDASPEHAAVLDMTLRWNLSLLYWPEDGYCPPLPYEVDMPTLEPLDPRWTSPDCFEEANIFGDGPAEKCAPWCLPWAPGTDEAGQATCRVYGEFWDDVDCEQTIGWTLVEKTTSKIDGYQGMPVNLCELRQAEGAALDACVNDFACEGCEPSFCFRRAFTEADEDDPAHQRPVPAADQDRCGSVDAVPFERLRLVHGADQFDGLLRVVCQK